ncbi:HAD family hydrolase [Streptomyces sp. 16-176A]|uniref:HAD family hydrolase n=1 Tax=Streptomyces sp. 16-176A TaxID=2530458 RepID=UPI00345DB67C
MLHDLRHLVDAVVDRAPYWPDAMKPDLHSLLKAAAQLDVHPHDCTLIGDSVTDMEASKATGGHSIGFANKPGEDRSLGEAGANVVVSTMTAVAEALSHSPRLIAPQARPECGPTLWCHRSGTRRDREHAG